MKHLLTLLLLCVAFAAPSQELEIDYPYNPDVDVDEQIGVTDLMGILSGFGDEFSPQAIMVDGEELSEFLLGIQTTIVSLQNQVIALQTELAEVQSHVVIGLNDHVSVVDSTNSVVVTGANFQITNGLGPNPISWLGQEGTNGLGNLIIGYNEETGYAEEYVRTGSHNLVIGVDHSYMGFGNIIGGMRNEVNGQYSACISREAEMNWGNVNLILGGKQSTMIGSSFSVMIGGQYNTLGTDSTDTRFSVLSGGRLHNLRAGYANSIFGGTTSSCDLPAATARSIFGGIGNSQQGGYGSSILGGHGTTAVIRDADENSYKADCLVGAPGRTFVGSTSSEGGELIDTTFGEGGQ